MRFRRLANILHRVDTITDWSGKIVSVFYLPLVAAMVYETGARYLFNAPTVWAHPLSILMCAGIGILGGVYCLRHGAHVKMDLFYSRLSPRGRAAIDIITSLFFFIFIIMLVYKGWEFALDSIIKNEWLTGFRWRAVVYPVKVLIPLTGCVVLLQGLAKFIRDLSLLVWKVEL